MHSVEQRNVQRGINKCMERNKQMYRGTNKCTEKNKQMYREE
jgi:hypothetical protein